MEAFYLKEKGIYYKTNIFKSNRLTLVFIHGLSGSSSAWLPYEERFKNEYNILTFDIRGHGKSKKFSQYSDYEITNFADDLQSLILHLGISKFILISHSFGFLIASKYIKLFGTNVLANVYLSPIFGLNKTFLSKIMRFILKGIKIFEFFPPYNLKPGKHIDYTKYPNSTDWSIKRCYADIKNTTLRVYLYCFKQSLNPSLGYPLKKMNFPVLIIHGSKDTMVPVKNSVALSKIIKNSEIKIISNTDHIVVLNNSVEICDMIEFFIVKNMTVEKLKKHNLSE